MNGQQSNNVTPIRVALMCENPGVYQTLGSRLSADRMIEVVGMYDCVVDQVPDTLAQRPHAVILGIGRITHFNMLICQTLRQAAPQVRIVVLPSYFDTLEDGQHAYTCGADVVLEKSIDTPALVERIQALVKSSA